MNLCRNEAYVDKLRKRRNEIMRTLDHVHKEQREVDDNKEWIDRAAYMSRCHLLDSLAHWYADESARIDEALIRVSEGRYGVCLSCRAPIESHRLETAPEAAFCAACQSVREALAEARREL